MNDNFFMDSNIPIYTFDSRFPNKQKKARELVATALSTRNGVISFQVVQEFLNVATRKFETNLTPQEAEKYLDQVLAPLCKIFASMELYIQAIKIMDRWQYSFYDSLIIAAALQANCNILYSEDLQHGQIIQTLTIVNPFLESSTTVSDKKSM